jgi:hypothetical protein
VEERRGGDGEDGHADDGEFAVGVGGCGHQGVSLADGGGVS